MVKQSPRQRHAKAAAPGARGAGAAKRSSAAVAPAAPAGGAGKPNRPPTPFEQRLYDVCKCIPAGRVATYGAMAQVLGSAPRACGQVSVREGAGTADLAFMTKFRARMSAGCTADAPSAAWRGRNLLPNCAA